jgi:hypothetical protein
VFDPLSILLLVVFNMAMDKANRKEEIIDDIVTQDPESNELIDQHVTRAEVEEQKDDVTMAEPIEEKTSLDEQLHTSLLYVLYHNGKLTENDHLDTYYKFIEKVGNSNIVCNELQIDAFLKKCVDLNIIKIGKKDRIALKNYTDALKTVKESFRK